MSWVADIILLASLEERITWDGPKAGTVVDEPPSIKKVNAWLKAGKWAPLYRLDNAIRSEKAFQACAYGAALNHLKIPQFLTTLARQKWQAPAALLLLIKNEEEPAFSVYRLREGKMVLESSLS